jgi:hypothetical protein
MNRDDIIRMAREAGDADRIDPFTKDGDWVILTPDELERFAALVASAEREACAKVCEDLVPTYLKDGERWLKGRNGKPDSRLKDLAPNLEAAWEAEHLLKHGSVIEKITQAHICANAIRARGQA